MLKRTEKGNFSINGAIKQNRKGNIEKETTFRTKLKIQYILTNLHLDLIFSDALTKRLD